MIQEEVHRYLILQRPAGRVEDGGLLLEVLVCLLVLDQFEQARPDFFGSQLLTFALLHGLNAQIGTDEAALQ